MTGSFRDRFTQRHEQLRRTDVAEIDDWYVTGPGLEPVMERGSR